MREAGEKHTQCYYKKQNSSDGTTDERQYQRPRLQVGELVGDASRSANTERLFTVALGLSLSLSPQRNKSLRQSPNPVTYR